MSREGGEVVALDLNLDDGLRKRGLSRDVVRLVQDLRKASAASRSPTASACHVVGPRRSSPSSSTSSPARCWPSRSCRAPRRGREGTVLDLDDEMLTEPVRVWIERVDRSTGRPVRLRQPSVTQPFAVGSSARQPVRGGSPGSSDPVSATWTPPVAAGSSTTRSGSVRTIGHRRRAVASAAAARSSTRSASRWVQRPLVGSAPERGPSASARRKRASVQSPSDTPGRGWPGRGVGVLEGDRCAEQRGELSRPGPRVVDQRADEGVVGGGRQHRCRRGGSGGGRRSGDRRRARRCSTGRRRLRCHGGR